MNGFKYKYTKYNESPNCHCENNVRTGNAARYSIEDEAVVEREASPNIFEVKKRVVYFTFKRENGDEDFDNCINLGFQWQCSGNPCTSCWLTLKKWKTSFFFESEQIELKAKCFKMGALVNFTKFNYHFIHKLKTCHFQHDRKEIHIYFDKDKKMVIQYNGLHRIFLMEKNRHVAVYLHLKFTPLIFETAEDNSNQVTSYSSNPKLEKDVLALSNMICLDLDKTKMKALLNSFRSRCPKAADFIFTNMTEQDLTDQKKYAPKIERVLALEWESFDTTYAWKVLLNTGYAVIDQILINESSKSFEEILNKILNLGSSELFEGACYAIFKRMDVGNILPIFDGLKFYCRQSDGNLHIETSNPDGIITIRKVIMTPTKRIYLPPQQHISNRALRNYNEDFVLQVSNKQDNMDLVTFHLNGNTNSNFMEANFKLKEGLQIGNKHFEFLGCSSSQLREHGFWMYAKDLSNKTAETIRQEIGFNNIRGGPSKKLSRLGLFFSSSVNSKELPENCDIKDIKDIEHNGYIFSDGIGRISPELAGELLGFRNEGIFPESAFQMRYPGYKGMLAVDPSLKGKQIIFRESMHKFVSNNTERIIDILKKSAPRRVYLNRSLSLVLEQKGISADVMLRLQDRMVHQLVTKLLTDSESDVLLKTSCHFLRIPYNRLHVVGFDLAIDPFLRTLITTGCQRRLSLLREKANVAVPDDQGRIMFGVLDEERILRPEEVFVQITIDINSKSSSKTKILEGPVIVTRNPCHHPGDIRLLQAVNHKKLRHHLDTIVFPQTGDRPLPDMMGGGDLDGDEFVVIWSKDLLFKTNDRPMSYKFENGQPRDQNSTVNELIDFYYDYLKFNDPGRVCNAHLVNAEIQPEGIRSEKCMEIAELIPKALDYNKTGILPAFREKIYRYPDYMEKFYLNPTYRSKSVLGKLYRKALQYFPHGGIAIKKLEEPPNPLLDYQGWEELRETAKDDKFFYENKLRAILTQQGLSSFEETIVGHVTKNSYASSKGDQDSLRTILEKSISLLIEETKRKFENQRFHLFLQKGIHEDSEKKEITLKLASAYYMVTYGQDSPWDFSFPWAIGEYLCEVAEANSAQARRPFDRSNTQNSCIKKMAEILEKKHKITWTEPLDYIKKWALENKLCEDTENNILPLVLIYTYFSENYNGCDNVYDALKQTIDFFEWASSDSMDYHPESVEDQKLLEKLVILASICYTGLPLSLNLAYLGFLDPDDDLETGPLDLKDLEGLRIAEKNSRINEIDFKCFLQNESGVANIHLHNQSPKDHHFDLIIKARGLAWQNIYLTNLVFDHYQNFCTPINIQAR